MSALALQVLCFRGKLALFILQILYCVSITHAASPKGVFASKYAAIVMDANSGKILHQINADARRYPASLTKMMTLYMLFEEMQAGRISRNTPIRISAYAASRPPTKLGLTPGQTITVEMAIKALIARSANDVAAAIGEYLAGSEGRFARKMTLRAHQLGMKNTKFSNASGLPDRENYSTARDMAILSLALREHFPQQYKLFNITHFDFRGRKIVSHNKLIRSMKGVDGIKTGFVQMSGFNLASSRKQGKKSIVAVVMGGETAAYRDAHMAKLLEKYMKQASPIKIVTFIVPRIMLGNIIRIVTPIAKDSLLASTSVPVAIPSKRSTLSDRKHDSVLLAALTNNIVVPTDVDSILVRNTPIPFSWSGHSIEDIINIYHAGWIIQIASSPSQKEVEKVFREAVKEAKNILAVAEPYIQISQKNNKKLYRVRFKGFFSKDEAIEACRKLKKMHFKCSPLKEDNEI